MKKILLLTVGFMNAAVAGVIKPGGSFTTEDVSVSDKAYQDLTTRANEIMKPILRDVQAAAVVVIKPFYAEKERLFAQRAEILQGESVLCKRRSEIERAMCVLRDELTTDFKTSLDVALSCLNVALEARRLPIQEQLTGIKTEISLYNQKIRDENQRYLSWKQQGYRLDSIDTMDHTRRVAALEAPRDFLRTQIEQLCASVDAGLPEAIMQVKKSMTELHEKTLTIRLAEMQAQSDALNAEFFMVNRQISEIGYRLEELTRQSYIAEGQAFEGTFELMDAIREEIVAQIISESSL